MTSDETMIDVFDQLIADEEKKDYPTKDLTIRVLREGRRLCKRNIPEEVEIVNCMCTHDDLGQVPEKNYLCPNCGRTLAVVHGLNCIYGKLLTPYCSYCGRALDWKETEK